jgi:cation diffusion facilitator CzcD-associated flavoprotein CzcO
MVTAAEYRNPGQLADGGVLVVGASATGIQLADEIHRSGRPVTVAVGAHVRAPRSYRGRDIQRWMDDTGMMDERYDEVDDIVSVRRLPSLQIVGRRTARRSTSTRSPPSGYASSVGSPASTTDALSSRDRCSTCARWPT